MSSGKIYVGSVGVEVRITMSEPIATAHVTTFVVRKPETGEVTWAATIEGESVLKYITGVGDLDEVGTYVLQPLLAIGGWQGYGTPVSFRVYDKWR